MEEKSYLSVFIILSMITLYASLAIFGSIGDAYDGKVAGASYFITGAEKANEANSSSDSALSYTDVVAAVEMYGSSKTITDSSYRVVYAAAFGEADLRYHFKLMGGSFFPTTLDFSTNILYNYSYIINTPSKLIHNIKADISFKDENANGLVGFAQKASMYIFIFWDVLHAITGVALAVPMLFIGCLFGLLFHPIDSLINIIPAVRVLFVTTWHAVKYIGNLFK